MKEKAILIGLITPDLKAEQVYEYLDELSFLAKTAGAIPIRNFTQKLKHPENIMLNLIKIELKKISY